MTEYLKELDGYRVRRTRRGFVVVECSYWAIPRTQEWVQQKQAALGPRRWQREYERSRIVGGEKAFFSEFSAQTHVRKISGLLPRRVLRGYDFGRRHPACVFLQHSPLSNRVWFLREMVLDDMDVYSFRDLVKYVSGELHIQDLQRRPKAMRYLEWLEKERDYYGQPMPKPPWFPPEIEFVDFAGHEATMDRSGILETESEEKTYSDVFRAGGIDISHHYYRVSSRVTLMRGLLGARTDGQPGAYFDPACPTLIRAMAGALPFKKGTKDRPAPEDPANIPRYLDVFDAASYPLPNVVGVDNEGSVVHEQPKEHQIVRGEDWRKPPDSPAMGEGFDSGLLQVWRE